MAKKYLIETLGDEQFLYSEEDGRFNRLAFNRRGYWQPEEIPLDGPIVDGETGLPVRPSTKHTRILNDLESMELLRELGLED